MLGLSGLAVAFLNTPWRIPGVGAALVFLFLAGATFSKAAQIASALRGFIKESVRVEVWGVALTASGGTIFEIEAISAIGLGLLVYLRATPDGVRSLLKIAQPKSAKVEYDRIEISEAAYVSWAGTKLWPAVGAKTPALVLVTRPNPRFNPHLGTT